MRVSNIDNDNKGEGTRLKRGSVIKKNNVWNKSWRCIDTDGKLLLIKFTPDLNERNKKKEFPFFSFLFSIHPRDAKGEHNRFKKNRNDSSLGEETGS